MTIPKPIYSKCRYVTNNIIFYGKIKHNVLVFQRYRLKEGPKSVRNILTEKCYTPLSQHATPISGALCLEHVSVLYHARTSKKQEQRKLLCTLSTVHSKATFSKSPPRVCAPNAVKNTGALRVALRVHMLYTPSSYRSTFL